MPQHEQVETTRWAAEDAGERAPVVAKHDEGALSPNPSSAQEENVQAIQRWERGILRARSKAEQISDRIACTAGSGPVLVLHVVWCGVWVTVNVGVIRGVRRFDPFPLPFLTMTVLLEAIFLALFVLASQNPLARQSDKHSHLDLQIHLLGERQMTAVLQLLRTLLASKRRDQRDVRTVARPHEETELRRLTTRMEELSEPMMPGDSTGIAAAPGS